MAKTKKAGSRRGGIGLSAAQVRNIRKLFERAIKDAAFRRRLIRNPRQVLAQLGIGLNAAQRRHVAKARAALLKAARDLEQAAVQAAKKLEQRVSFLRMSTKR